MAGMRWGLRGGWSATAFSAPPTSKGSRRMWWRSRPAMHCWASVGSWHSVGAQLIAGPPRPLTLRGRPDLAKKPRQARFGLKSRRRTGDAVSGGRERERDSWAKRTASHRGAHRSNAASPQRVRGHGGLCARTQQRGKGAPFLSPRRLPCDAMATRASVGSAGCAARPWDAAIRALSATAPDPMHLCHSTLKYEKRIIVRRKKKKTGGEQSETEKKKK